MPISAGVVDMTRGKMNQNTRCHEQSNSALLDRQARSDLSRPWWAEPRVFYSGVVDGPAHIEVWITESGIAMKIVPILDRPLSQQSAKQI
jgi:hypothetical protein